MHKLNSLQIISDIIFKNNLYILPLYSINENKECTCGKIDCTSPGKHPLFKYNWKVIATNDEKKIRHWFEDFNKINFGLATGRFCKNNNKYLIVIDIDANQHDFMDRLPPTFCYQTGSGGWHFWFWSKYAIKNSVSLLADNVDVRGTDGYVVIPPSKNKKGLYGNISNYDIADLPEDIVKEIFNKQKNTKKINQSVLKIKTPNLLKSDWIKNSIPKIREKISNNEIVPNGVRNVVMHRLLSSDRAKGAQKNDLITNSKIYLKSFSDPESLEEEIDIIINSVLKYPIYNNMHEKVNELYVNWLKKNKKGSCNQNLLKDLNEADSDFFKNLKKSEENKGVCTLEQIILEREKFLKSKGIVQISNYKPQLFAKKLISYGFSKRRTAKCNYWNIVL